MTTPNHRRLFRWPELDDVPSASGIYAWYYRHTFYTHDIDTLIAQLQQVQGPGSEEEREKRVAAFLQSFLFNVFLEEPYEVSIHGPLKPTYAGSVPHSSTITPGLVKRITSDPFRLRQLQTVLESAVPEFASPIYIGLSVDLRTRIRRHCSLMQKYKGVEGNRDLSVETDNEEEKRDHSFARDVVRRGVLLHRLEVAVRLVQAAGDVHLDAENILNRINYPLCGRS